MSVYADSAHVDLVLSAEVPIGSLIPAIVDILAARCGFGAQPVAIRLQLSRPGDVALDPSKTLAQNGIRDGATLILTDSSTELMAPRFDDTAQGVSVSLAAAVRPWTRRAARLVGALLASWLAGAGAAVLMRTAFETGDAVFAAGLSMSALFVLLLAEEFGVKLAGGICLAPTLFFDGWNVPWYNRLLPLAAYTPLKYSFYFKEGPPYGIKNEKIRGMVHRFYSKAKLADIDGISKYGYAFFPVSLFHQLKRLARKIIPMLRRIDTPMLLIHPQDDDTASVKNSQLIYDRISSDYKKLVILTGSYHVITADQEREKVVQALLQFLEET